MGLWVEANFLRSYIYSFSMANWNLECIVDSVDDLGQSFELCLNNEEIFFSKLLLTLSVRVT